MDFVNYTMFGVDLKDLVKVTQSGTDVLLAYPAAGGIGNWNVKLSNGKAVLFNKECE